MRGGFSLMEMMAATAVMAVLMGTVVVVVRSGYAVWNAQEQDINALENEYGVLRHFVRQMRQADAVTSITAANNTAGSLSFLTATGAIGKANQNAVLVETTVATIGIRGTQFWGGRLETDFEVLVLEGRVVVFNAAGFVDLTPGQTTSVAGIANAPTAAAVMPDDRRTRAFATVQFAN